VIADDTAPIQTVTATAIAAASNDNSTVSIGDIDPDEEDTDVWEVMPTMKPKIVHANPHSNKKILQISALNAHANAHFPCSTHMAPLTT